MLRYSSSFAPALRRNVVFTLRPLRFAAPAALLLLACKGLPSAPQTQDLAAQIFDVMSHMPQVATGHRVVHAKGLVGKGTFQATPAAATLSRAAHFSGQSVPITVRFSDSGPDAGIADGSRDASPRGMAIRFAVGSGGTDIVTNSHNGFIVGTGEEFLALQQAIAATDPSKPHPWAIESFLMSHRSALKFVQDPKPTPVSFANESFYGNNAFIFIDKKGHKQAVRYQILPAAGPKYLDDAAAKAAAPNLLADELRERLAKGPAQFRLVAQLANPGDSTKDSTMVWPDDRKKVELGTITITSLVPDNAAAENELAFDPIRVTDGIELSDDPLPLLRSRVYAIASATRRAQQAAAAKASGHHEKGDDQ
jgi:catalase